MNEMMRSAPPLDRIDRFQSLQAGEYWSALTHIPEEAIEAGDTLLLMSVRYVENVPHTVILRAHPRHYDQYVHIEFESSDGKLVQINKKMSEHRFLVNDFLNTFEFQPEHQQIREREIASVHAEVALIQQELNSTLSTPSLMKAVVESQLRSDEEKERTCSSESASPGLPPALYDEAVPLVTGTVINALGRGVSTHDLQAMKLAAQREHRIAEIQSQWLLSKNKQISHTLGKLMPYFNEMPAAALARTEDVRTYVDNLQSGIKSIFLYTGDNVHIETIQQGESAPPSIPLTLVQKKLIIEEELSLWADVDEWFDCRRIPLFFKTLCDQPSFVDQIFPSQRCVLVMAATNHDLNYGEPWANESMNRENRRVFLMVRDGENIYQVFSPVESHLSSYRLFPSQDEAEGHFRGLDGTRIKFDDVAYTDRLNSFEVSALHYKRFLILLCGLDHREKLFGDFYDEPMSMNFVSLAFQEKYCRFLHDDDGTGLLALKSERPSLSQYIREVNSYVRSGSRILCNWYSLMNPLTAPGACKDQTRQGYRSFYFTARPEKDVSMSIAYRKGQALFVDVPVKREYADTRFNCKVELSANSGSYDDTDHQLPYLCLDAVEPDDLEWYVVNRQYRRDHLFYIRFFKAAIKYIRQERQEETQIRTMMAEALECGHIGKSDERHSLIQQAVIAWRAANRGAPMTDALLNKKAWQSVLDQMYMLAGSAGNQISDVETFVTGLGYKPLRLVVNSSGKLAVYAESLPEERDERIEKHFWVHRINIVIGKRKIRESSRSWALLPESLAAETTVHQWDDAHEWTGKQSVFTSFNSKKRIFQRIDRCSDILNMFSGTMSEESFNRVFDEWSQAYDALMFKSSIHITPYLLIPIGYRIRAEEQDYLCVGNEHPEQLLYKLAPDDYSRQQVVKAYVSYFKHEYKEKYAQELIAGAAMPTRFTLFASGEANISNDRLFNVSGFPRRVLGTNVLPDRFADAVNFYLAELDSHSKQNSRKVAIYLSTQLQSDDGELRVDEMLNNAMPESYKPVDLVNVYLNDYRRNRSRTDENYPQCHYAASGVEVKYHDWYDICPRHVDNASLICGVVSQDIRIQRLPFNNKEDALEYINRNHFHDTYKPLAEQPDVPKEAMPPAGTERFVKG